MCLPCLCICWLGASCFVCNTSYSRNYPTRVFFLAVWALFNILYYFSYTQDLCYFVFKLYELLYFHYIIQAIQIFFILLNLSHIINKNLERHSQISDFKHSNNFLVLLNLILYSFDDGLFEKFMIILPIIFQILYASLLSSRDHYSFLVLWITGFVINYLSLSEILNAAYICLIFLIEYPLIIGLLVMIIKRMESVIENINNVKEKFNKARKNKKQLFRFFFIEAANYLLLAFGYICIYFAKEFIEMYHGYKPALLEVIAKVSYCVPVASLMSYPGFSSRVLNVRMQSMLNVVCIGFTVY